MLNRALSCNIHMCNSNYRPLRPFCVRNFQRNFMGIVWSEVSRCQDVASHHTRCIYYILYILYVYTYKERESETQPSTKEYQWSFFFLNQSSMTPFLTSPPSARRNCGSRRVAPSSVESVEPNVWLGTDHQKFQRSTKSATGLLTLPKHLMYGILCLPTFIMKNQPLIQIYIYIYSSPMEHMGFVWWIRDTG